MCENLRRLIQERLRPEVDEALAHKEMGNERRENLSAFMQTLREIESDIEGDAMDEWECGELYEEFQRYLSSGEFLDKIA